MGWITILFQIINDDIGYEICRHNLSKLIVESECLFNSMFVMIFLHYVNDDYYLSVQECNKESEKIH